MQNCLIIICSITYLQGLLEEVLCRDFFPLLLLLLCPMYIVLGTSFKHIKFALRVLPNLQYAGQIATAITVVGRTPYGA